MDEVRRRLLISGVVQGVAFRESTRRVATDARVRGWVRNLSDGRVEVVLEGPELVVAGVVEWCRTGPPAARVEFLEELEEVPEGLSSFTVR